jgi:hypothetical protein
VWIGLVADIPDQPVVGRVESVVDGHRQLNDAQSRTQMSARDRDRLDGLSPQFRSHLFQLGFWELAQVMGRGNPVEKRCFGGFGQSLVL